MSLLLIEGFETVNSSADMTAQQWSAASSVTIVTSVVRTGGRAANTDSGGDLFRKDLGADEHATVIVGSGIRNSGLSSPWNITFRADANATTHVTINYNSSGQIQAFRGTTGGTLLGTSATAPITANIFQYIEAKVTLSDTVGVVVVRVDGVEVLNLTNQDTKNAGTETVLDAVQWNCPSGSNCYYDDIYICNGAGSAPYNDLLGECRVQVLLPNGNGNSSQMVGSDGNSTDNYQLVDELPMATADYVQSDVDNNKDTYTFGNLSAGTTTVHGLRLVANALKTDTNARSFAFVTRSGGSESDSSDHTLSLNSSAYYQQLQAANPLTSSAWTQSEVDAAEFGVKARP